MELLSHNIYCQNLQDTQKRFCILLILYPWVVLLMSLCFNLLYLESDFLARPKLLMWSTKIWFSYCKAGELQPRRKLFSISFLGVEFFCVAVIFLVLFKFSHPLGPIAELNTASFGPGAVYVEPAMPLELPQLLKTNSSDGPIHEDTVHKAIMSVHAEAPYGVAVPPPRVLTVKFWRLVGDFREASGVLTINKHRDDVATFDVQSPPISPRMYVSCIISSPGIHPKTSMVSSCCITWDNRKNSFPIHAPADKRSCYTIAVEGLGCGANSDFGHTAVIRSHCRHPTMARVGPSLSM